MTGTVSLTFAELLSVLSQVFAVPDGGRKALIARLKHLQSKRFPPGVNVGRGGGVRYDLQAIFRIITVLTLTSAFIPPNQAVDVVKNNFEDWQALLHSAARFQIDGRLQASAPVAIIESNALSSLGEAVAQEGRAASARGSLTLQVTDRAKLADNPSQRGAATVIDVVSVLSRAAPLVATAAGLTLDQVLEALAAS